MANLAQLRMLEKLDGFLLVDKPSGIAFSTVVKTVKRKFNLVKVGHGGSLDAMASGLLILLINDANKFVGDVMGADRSYEGTMRLGVKTDTQDIYGRKVVHGEDAAGGARRTVEDAMAQLRGDVFQTESRYCSVRKEGSASYEIADTGEHSPFLAHVYRFDVNAAHVGADSSHETDVPFVLRATKGLIVRTLVNDFGDLLGSGAVLASLRRTQIGKFSVADAVSFDRILKTEMSDFSSLVLPLSKALA